MRANDVVHLLGVRRILLITRFTIRVMHEIKCGPALTCPPLWSRTNQMLASSAIVLTWCLNQARFIEPLETKCWTCQMKLETNQILFSSAIILTWSFNEAKSIAPFGSLLRASGSTLAWTDIFQSNVDQSSK